MTINITQNSWYPLQPPYSSYNFSGNFAYPNVIFCDYTISNPVSTTSPLNLGMLMYVSNPASQTLWLEVSGTVTLASGSTAIVDFPTTQLGSFASSSGEFTMLNNIIVSSYPTTSNPFELETINATFTFYLDSEYTQVFDSTSTSFNIDFINPLSTSWEGSAIIYSGTNSGITAVSTSNILSYSSSIFIGSGYSLYVSTQNFSVTTSPGFTGASCVTSVSIPSGAYFLAEYFIYPTISSIQLNVYTTNIMNPNNLNYFSISSNGLVGRFNPINSSLWQVVYDIGQNLSTQSWNFVGDIEAYYNIPIYYGFCRVMWSNKNILF